MSRIVPFRTLDRFKDLFLLSLSVFLKLIELSLVNLLVLGLSTHMFKMLSLSCNSPFGNVLSFSLSDF